MYIHTYIQYGIKIEARSLHDDLPPSSERKEERKERKKGEEISVKSFLLPRRGSRP